MEHKTNNRAVLIYDGDCGICREWVEYWKNVTGEEVDYRPYQEIEADYPAITGDEFRRAIQFIEPDGARLSGAGAVFRLYRKHPPYSLLTRLYRRLRGFAYISEYCYRFFSRHRGVLGFMTHLFWGKGFVPARYHIISWIFLRLLGCIYLAAFASLSVQIRGLIGSEGILPLNTYLYQLKDQLGQDAYWRVPTLFWFHLNDGFLDFICLAGVLLSLFVIFNILQRTSLLLLYLLYLSLYYAGQTFMTFQWDMLLLEAGFLAIFLTTGSHIIIWLYRWLLFRFMFMGGAVKLLSLDPAWDHLTALNYYFETQPLPTPLAWYAHHLPQWLLMGSTAATLIIELLFSFLIFSPRRFRMIAACCIILFQSLIVLTGNYNFFNLLTIAICLFLFDDAALNERLPGIAVNRLSSVGINHPGKMTTAIASLFAMVAIYTSLEQMGRYTGAGRDKPLSAINRLISPFQIVNSYGPFAVMSTTRNEIIIEGSRDRESWTAYGFKYKPGDLSRRPEWIIPHQPRLDWQMWFAALSNPWQTWWFENLLLRLLTNSKAVTGLFAFNPFPDKPPQSVRARFYEYHFTDAEERKQSGNWWKRKLVGEYYPAITLSMKVEEYPR